MIDDDGMNRWHIFWHWQNMCRIEWICRIDRICAVCMSRIEWRMCPTRWNSKYFVFYWKLGCMNKITFSTIMLTLKTKKKLYSKIPSCYLNSRELTFCSSKSLDFCRKNKLFIFHQICSKLRCGIGGTTPFQAKTNILDYNNILALDSFRENYRKLTHWQDVPRDRICPTLSYY